MGTEGQGKRELVTLADAGDGVQGDMATIHHLERDRGLSLAKDTWGAELLVPAMRKERGWRVKKSPARYLHRKLLVRKSEGPDDARGELKDHIIPFPSAPIYGTNRRSDYGIELSHEPMHTLRLLTRPDNRRRIGRLFIFHNGLNEGENLRFYYQLADWILQEDDPKAEFRSACLIVPFPGHLTHAAFPGPFSQTPLQRYLSDSGELFRQFLRYTIEMRWLLSAINRKPPENWMVGGAPISNDVLAKEIAKECEDLREASGRALKVGRDKLNESELKALMGVEIEQPAVEKAIKALEDALERSKGRGEDTLSIHVIGYSLGGFLAQSVFFAWPNMVSSCATICSGGAIRALSPTAFAHPEEWQAVLHTLRHELEASMLRRRIARSSNKISGLKADQFGYYQRIFDQVFLQDDHASYKARLSEYGTRMLFMGGGEDPIVRPREVLDASPKEGITMLSVANLTHFLGETARSKREIEQRKFWLPETGGLIARAAVRAEQLHAQDHNLAEEKNSNAKKIERRSKRAERIGKAAQEKERKVRKEEERTKGEGTPKRPKDRDLESPTFESALDWVIDGVTSRSRRIDEFEETSEQERINKLGKGWLFVCRNGLPAAFLNAGMQRAWATGLRHHDVFVQKYAEGLTRRAAELRTIRDRTTLVLPSDLKDMFVYSSGELIDPHSDAPGYLATTRRRQSAWKTFIEEWGDQVQWFKPGPIEESCREAVPADEFAAVVGAWHEVPTNHLKITHVPDVWIAVDDGDPYTPDSPDQATQRLCSRVKSIVKEEASALLEAEEKYGSGFKPKKPLSDVGRILQDDLDHGKIRIVRVSATELNPRYRGRFENSFPQALPLLEHCVAALLRADDEPDPVD